MGVSEVLLCNNEHDDLILDHKRIMWQNRPIKLCWNQKRTFSYQAYYGGHCRSHSAEDASDKMQVGHGGGVEAHRPMAHIIHPEKLTHMTHWPMTHRPIVYSAGHSKRSD